MTKFIPDMENYGGQAVIEGVMMKSSSKLAVAARLPSGKIKIKKDNIREKKKWLKLPIIRGVSNLIEMLIIGIKALLWSADQQLEKHEKMTKKEVALTMLFSIGFGIILFIVVPFFLTGLFVNDGLVFNIVDGVIRVLIFIGYILIISMFSDVKRLFEYHGAEHKVVNAYENEKKLDQKTISKYSTVHNRCGTTFIFIVLVFSIIVFSLIIWEQWYIKLMSRIILIPLIAGVSYEILKLGDKYKGNIILKMMTYPGLLLQKITTKEPSKEQIEVAVKALKEVL